MDGDWCPDPTCIVDNILFEFVRSSWKTLANTAKKCWKIFQTKKRELHSFIHLVKWSDGNSVRSMVTREKETEIDIWWGVWEKVEKSKKEIVFVFVALVFFSLLHSSLLVFSHRRTSILIFDLIGNLSVKGVLKSLIFNTVERNGEIETKKNRENVTANKESSALFKMHCCRGMSPDQRSNSECNTSFSFENLWPHLVITLRPKWHVYDPICSAIPAIHLRQRLAYARY